MWGDVRENGVLLRKRLRILPHPVTDDDIAAGYRYELSVLQAGFSLTQVLDAPTVTDGRSPEVAHRRLQGRGTRQRGMRFRGTTRSRRDQPVLPAWLRESPPTDGA